MIERNKTNVALDGLFEQFLNLISEARRVPLVDKIMVDENDLLNIIDDLKEAIPREIKSANQVLEEQKNIVNKAYADADRVLSVLPRLRLMPRYSRRKLLSRLMLRRKISKLMHCAIRRKPRLLPMIMLCR